MKTIIIAAIAAILASAATAFAQTSHILGHDGPTVPLSAMCTRAVVPPPGETLEMSVNVIGQQVHCLIRRPDHFAVCVDKNLPVPAAPVGRFDHGAGKPGDWTGVKGLYNYLVGVANCSQDHGG